MRPSTLLFHLTHRLPYTKFRDPGEEPKLHLFGQLKRIAKQWLDTCLVCKGRELVEVTFGSFRKTYFLDVLVAAGGLFEFKAVEALVARHRAQLLNYLLLCDLAHGKLINMRTEDV